MQRILILLLVLVSATSHAQQKSMLLLNGFLHAGNGETLPSAAIGIRNGEITLIKNSLAFTFEKSDWDTIVDLNGRHIYPGFVAPNSTLGMTEIDAVRATRDFDEVGRINPHVRSQIVYNVESEVIATVRSNGVLICQATPRGGLISGTSSIMFMDGWNWEDATLQANDGIHVNWPSPLKRSEKNHTIKEKSDDYNKSVRELYQFFEAAKAYNAEKRPEKQDLRYAAMANCFKGNQRVYFHANHLQQLQDIIDFCRETGIAYPVIVGGYDSYLITRELKDAKIPVMLYRTHSLPEREDDPVNLPYAVASRLQEGGVMYCIQNEGDMEAMNARNLPFLAGTAKAYGLTEEQAIAAISLNACKIMGIDKKYGSIEVGKSATLFVSEGSVIDMRTSSVYMALIDGKPVDLDTKQKRLYEKYSNKYHH